MNKSFVSVVQASKIKKRHASAYSGYASGKLQVTSVL